MPENTVFPLEIDSSGVRRLLESGEPVVILDARGRAVYARSPEHVAGDVRAPGTRDLSWAEGLPRDAWLLAWCT